MARLDPALHALLERLVDDAALFPPASRPLDDALAADARYRAGDDAWMLGRFILPAGRLVEAAGRVVAAFGASRPLPVTVLGTRGPDRGAPSLDDDLAAIRAGRAALAGAAAIEAYEGFLAPELLAPGARSNLEAELGRAVDTLAGGEGLSLAFEVPRTDDWRAGFARAAAALARAAASLPRGGPRVAFKLRCGGLEPAAFPTDEQVAAAIAISRAHGLAFKATAGLHHPLPREAPDIPARMHGFVNVFAAAVLAHENDLTEDELVPIVAEPSARAFRFDAGALIWRDRRVPADAIRRARCEFALSFGSCSFDEPRADLRALGWLPPAGVEQTEVS